MINKKSHSPDSEGFDAGISRHQDLLERFRDSRQTPREFITYCLKNNMVSGADALELLTVLKSKVTTRSFALADLSDEEYFRQGLYETTREDSENNPVFVIQFDNKLEEYSEDIQELLETFSRNVAELVSHRQDVEDIKETEVGATREEAMETILDSLPVDSLSH